MTEAWIIDAARSPRGGGKPGKGAFTDIHPHRVLAQVLNGLRDKVGFDPSDVEDVITGCTVGTGDHGMDIGRLAVLDAGWPVTVPGIKLDRYCGSGQNAVNFAAMSVMSGQQDLVIGSGVEFMSHGSPASPRFAPARYANKEGGYGFHVGNDHLFEMYPLVPQGISADLIATVEGFTREECDTLAVESQCRAEIAVNEGRFKNAIVPIYDDDGNLVLDHDEHPRPGTTMEALAGLRLAFAEMATTVQPGFDKTYEAYCKEAYPQIDKLNFVHHGGNSSGVVDGASALLMASPEYAKAHGLKPRAKIVKTAVVGTEPVIMLTAPGPAALKCLEKAGMTKDDIDLWEINESFAAVVLKFFKATGVNPEVTNVNGGAIALGHPIGATGPMLIQTVIDELERQDKSVGLVAMCTGGGMGTATIVERI
jgi:acetyl-CoA C-acetyltransferase